MTITLYKAAEEFEAVLDQIDPETGELPAEYGTARELVERKSAAVAAYIAQREMEADAISERLKEIEKRVKAMRARAAHLRRYTADCMRTAGISEIASEDRDALLGADAENRALRRLLAVRVSGASLYTDDGELQDNSQHPCIDYYFDSPAEIHRKLQKRAERAEAEREAKAEIELLRKTLELQQRKPTIEELRGENAVLAGLLRDCDAVLATIEADDGDEAEKVSDLRMALAYALDPYKRGHIPSRVQLVTANPVGRQNMRAALEVAGYVTRDGSNFARDA